MLKKNNDNKKEKVIKHMKWVHTQLYKDLNWIVHFSWF